MRGAHNDMRKRGASNSPLAVERSDRQPGLLITGTQSSLTYTGAVQTIAGIESFLHKKLVQPFFNFLVIEAIVRKEYVQ